MSAVAVTGLSGLGPAPDRSPVLAGHKPSAANDSFAAPHSAALTESGLHGALAKGHVRASRASKRLGLAHGAPQTRWLKSGTGMRSAVGSEVLAPWAIAVLCDAPARR